MVLLNKQGYIKGIKISTQQDDSDWTKFPVEGHVVKDAKGYKFVFDADVGDGFKVNVSIREDALHELQEAIDDKAFKDYRGGVKLSPFSEERKKYDYDVYDIY
jgi:hypothetical protein